MAKEELVLCKMFTGDYWENENNLGYETINMFLPDGENDRIKRGEEPVSYMYLPADGDYKLDDHEITDVLLVRSMPDTDGQTVQVIGKAKVIPEEGEVLRNWLSSNYKCLSGGREFNGLLKIFNAVNPKFKSGDKPRDFNN